MSDTFSQHRFSFDLDRAIREQVVMALEASPELPLTKGVGPNASGIYALYRDGELVYVGKATIEFTKSKRSLRSRLNEHILKINGRVNISLEEMSCRFLMFDREWWVFAAEFAVIAHYKPKRFQRIQDAGRWPSWRVADKHMGCAVPIRR